MAIHRSPCEYFIKFLLSQQEHEPNAILQILEDFNLGTGGLGISYIKRLQRDMEPVPEPWDLTDKDGPTREYLKKHKIHDLYFPHAHVQEAYGILSSAQLREDIEQLLLSPLRIEEVVKRINRHYNMTMTIEGAEAYRHYFWNKSLLSMQEWMEVLEGTPMGSESITMLRVSPDVAQSLVPWIAGMAGPPKTLNTGTVARRMRDIAFLKVLEIERQPATLAHSKMMKNYMDVVRGAEAEMRQSEVALKDVLKAFEKFRLRKDDNSVPSIEEVAGPNFSHSGEGTGAANTADDIMEDDDG
jgi:hypothetical protein